MNTPAKLRAVLREIVGDGPVHHPLILHYLYVLLHLHTTCTSYKHTTLTHHTHTPHLQSGLATESVHGAYERFKLVCPVM